MLMMLGIISAKNLPRARDFDFLAASGITAHSGCEVKIKTSVFRAAEMFRGSGFSSREFSSHRSSAACVTETRYGAVSG